MIELIILGLVILAQFGLLFWYIQESKRQQDKLINALISRNPQDQANLDLIDKMRPEKPVKDKTPDLIATDNIPTEEFLEKIIGKEVV